MTVPAERPTERPAERLPELPVAREGGEASPRGGTPAPGGGTGSGGEGGRGEDAAGAGGGFRRPALEPEWDWDLEAAPDRGRPIRALIVDDEYPARAELRYRLSREPGVEITGEAATAREALRLIEALDYDVVFLDIAMPGLSGLELAERLKNQPGAPSVVFTTAYDEYAVKAFEARALDYLLKPYSDDRLREALNRVRERLAAAASPGTPDPAPSRAGSPAGGPGKAAEPATRGGSGGGPGTGAPGGAGGAGAANGGGPGARGRARWVMGVRDEAAVPIPVEEVVYAEAENDQVFVYTATHRFPTRYTLRELEELLPPDRFFRCHRGYIVNLRKVREISPFFNGTYNLTVVHAGQPVTIPVARSRVPELKRHFWPEQAG
ncbi:MAG TPA: LytTR family DNA-binding domain-containing protein [Thermaerobacter sp.]